MYRRRLQLIAGATYTVSLPKEWVLKNNLKEKCEVEIHEQDDRALLISPFQHRSEEHPEISINLADYAEVIDQVLFAVYYLGKEAIRITSKKEIAPQERSRIRETLTDMSGTEVSFEDKHTIIIKVLIDKAKVDINQSLYRIVLIIEQSIINLLGPGNRKELEANEEEVDRLYHLAIKVISIALKEAAILQSSGIRNVTLIPSYFLISKKLENIADNIYYLSGSASCEKKEAAVMEHVLKLVREELGRSAAYLLGNGRGMFSRIAEGQLAAARNRVEGLTNTALRDNLRELVRYLMDVESELINISFLKKLYAMNRVS